MTREKSCFILPSFSIYQYCFVGKASQSLNHLESYLIPFRSSSAWYVALSKASMEILLHLKKNKLHFCTYVKIFLSFSIYSYILRVTFIPLFLYNSIFDCCRAIVIDQLLISPINDLYLSLCSNFHNFIKYSFALYGCCLWHLKSQISATFLFPSYSFSNLTPSFFCTV